MVTGVPDARQLFVLSGVVAGIVSVALPELTDPGPNDGTDLLPVSSVSLASFVVSSDR